MFLNVYFCFLVKRRSFQLLSEFLRTGRTLIFLYFLSFSSQTPIESPQPAHLKLTFLHFQEIRNLNALACLPQNVYLCIGNGRKGSISRMSDECLMKWKRRFSYYTRCQAVMRKFTLAGKTSESAKYADMFNDSLTRYEYKDVVSTTFLVEHLIL